MPHDPIASYTMGDYTPTERKVEFYRDVPVRRCMACRCVLSRYNGNLCCAPCLERGTYAAIERAAQA